MTLVIAASNGGRLDTKEEYEKMWALQDALEEQKGVGTVLSLPVLMTEGHRHAFAFLFSWDRLLKIMDEPKHERASQARLSTKNRKLAAFYFRMNEHQRNEPRLSVVDRLRTIVRQHGFRPVLIGGVYQLQGQLAKMVRSSLISGLFWLLVFFAGHRRDHWA